MKWDVFSPGHNNMWNTPTFKQKIIYMMKSRKEDITSEQQTDELVDTYATL